MGFYINPEGSKSDWLQNNGTKISTEDAVGKFDSLRAAGKTPVALVKGFFSSAPVLDTKKEAAYFSTGEAAEAATKFFSVNNNLLATVMKKDDAKKAGVI